MKRLIFALAACAAIGLCGWCPGLRGDEPPKDQAKSDPAKELAALQKEWTDALQAFIKAYQDAKTPEDKQQVLKEKRPKPADFADRFFKLAEKYPDSPAAWQALGWVVSNAHGTEAANKALTIVKERVTAASDLDQLHTILKGLPPVGLGELAPQIAEKAKKNLDHPQAVPLLMLVCSATAYSGAIPEQAKLYDSTVDLLMERFPERKELAPLATWLPRDTNPDWAEKHLRRLVEKNPEKTVVFNAKFGLASLLQNKDEASQPEAEKLFQSLVDDNQMTEQAKNELAEMKVRGIGKSVPDITGDDLDSKSFKLSDYKGKVVLLDFWGFW
jgi:hypothetical protein